MDSKKIINILLQNHSNHLSKNTMTDLATRMHVKPEQIKEMYQTAIDRNLTSRIEELSLSHVIRKEFVFLGDLFYKFVSEGKFNLLHLPLFPSSSSFPDIVQGLAGDRFTKGLTKRFGKKLEINGVGFLNNVFCLNQIYYDRPLNLDDVLNLDHSKRINQPIADCMKDLKIMRDSYPLKRIWEIITDADTHTLEETKCLVSFNVDKFEDAIKRSFPKKPKAIIEIHDAIHLAVMNSKRTNHLLEQDIAFLDGRLLFDYVIEVPHDSFALISTSVELKHCVSGYDQMVIKKKCQIINLLKNKKRIYTIELIPKGDHFEIRQFKGYANENSMEGEKGAAYRNELLELIHENNIKNDSSRSA